MDFFRALRKFMMASAVPLNARLKVAAKPPGKAGGSPRGGPASPAKAPNDDDDNNDDAGLQRPPGSNADDVTNGGEGLNELEALLSVSELRTSFAFTKVAAQKYRQFLDVHFDVAAPGGVDLAKLGWKLYLAAKHSLLPKFPDLYSCYHLLVVVQAFLLVNAPRGLTRTELRNMVSMSVKDDAGDVDALASLSVTSKTKLPLLRSTMEDFQRVIVQGLIAAELGTAGGDVESTRGAPTRRSSARGAPGPKAKDDPSPAVPSSSALQPAESPGEGLAKAGPARFPALIPDADDDKASTRGLAAAHAAADAAYAKACAPLGHLRLDERLYIPTDAETEADSLRVLGDIKKPAAVGGSGGVAATPGPGKNLDGVLGGTHPPGGVPGTPWRLTSAARSLLTGRSPARLGTPYRAGVPGGTGSTAAANNGVGGGGGGGAMTAGPRTPAVPFTPISEAMASASWLHAIVAPPSPNGTPKRPSGQMEPTQRLTRFVSEEVAKKLMDSVHNLAGKTSAALREDAFLVTINGVGLLAGQGHNVSLDNLVKRRQEEAVRVFAYFLELILENEQRHVIRQAEAASTPAEPPAKTASPAKDAGGSNGDKSGARRGSVADIAAIAAEQKEDASLPPPPPTEAQRAGFEALLGSGRFVRSVLACSMEVVVASYKTATLKFPAIPRLLGLDAFDVSSIIEPFVRADVTMPREVKKHFNALEETIMETLAWSKGSSLFGFMRAAESGHLPARGPAAAALAAVSGRGQPAAGDAAADSPGDVPAKPGVADTKPSADAGAGAEKTMRRERSFSVAAVAEAAADGEDLPGTPGSVSPAGRARRTDKGDHIAAFSTPLKGATTPARPGQTKPRLSMGGADAEPLPKRFVRDALTNKAASKDTPPIRNGHQSGGDPSSGGPAGLASSSGTPGPDPAVVNSLRVFFAKVMRLSARRLADLCERLSLPAALTQQSYALVEHALYEHTSLLYNRHLDQVLLCAVYGACKVNKDTLLKGRTVPFREIIYQYEKQPQCREEVFWTVILTQTDPELEVKQQGDIIEFYNKVFVPEIKAFLLSLKSLNLPSAGPSPMKSPNGPMTSPNAAPMSPLPAGLQSPRRMLGGIRPNVYVSPMRSDKALASLAGTFTPRSKSLYAFLGESTHAYQSPARDLNFINRRISSSAGGNGVGGTGGGGTGVGGGGGGNGGVADVAGEVAALPRAVTGGVKRDGPPAFDEGSPGDGKPPKAPRLA